MCKIDHTAPDALPQFLCRACHPELVPTVDQLRLAHAVEKVALDRRLQQDRLRRELHKAKTKLASCTKNGEPPEGSINSKIARSMRKKLTRVEKELEALNAA